jgi:hypothetical protein
MNSRLSELGHLGFSLIPKEGIVKFLVIDVDFAHLWLDSLSCLLTQSLTSFFGLDGVSLFSNSGLGDPGL